VHAHIDPAFVHGFIVAVVTVGGLTTFEIGESFSIPVVRAAASSSR
jgi:hypothetical protein